MIIPLIIGAVLLVICWITFNNIEDEDTIKLLANIAIILCMFVSIIFTVWVSEDSNISTGAKKYIQHPKQFKIEYKYTQHNDSLICTDTIVTLNN